MVLTDGGGPRGPLRVVLSAPRSFGPDAVRGPDPNLECELGGIMTDGRGKAGGSPEADEPTLG